MDKPGANQYVLFLQIAWAKSNYIHQEVLFLGARVYLFVFMITPKVMN